MLAATALLGCSAADNLTYPEIANELDRIVTVRGTGFERRLEYADRAEVSVWYMRNVLFVPFRIVLGFLAGGTTVAELENPSEHVRELLLELPDEAGADLDRGSDAIHRLLEIAELEQNPANVIVALDGATRVLRQLGETGVGDPATIDLTVDPTRLDAARAAVQLSRPRARTADGSNFPAAAMTAYRAALTVLVERPLASAWDRRALIADLRTLWRNETIPELRETVAADLRTALGHAVHAALIAAMRTRDADRADIRLCAIQSFRSLGGPECVPFLLALKTVPGLTTARVAERFDPDPLVQLRLIHLCGQVRGEIALRAVALPGREAWEAIAPADFLAQTVLTEQAYYSKLRTPALTALCLCLGKPRLDYGIQWVEEWYTARQRG
ncbi:MAG: hypothetical protein NXI31_18620 [bacterium]|nr:hypothetical protein [bacterium]